MGRSRRWSGSSHHSERGAAAIGAGDIEPAVGNHDGERDAGHPAEHGVLDRSGVDGRESEDVEQHIADLEHDLDKAIEQLQQNQRLLEDKDTKIDILENRIKQMRIDVMVDRRRHA